MQSSFTFRMLPSYYFSNSGHGFRPGGKRSGGKIQVDHQQVREELLSGKKCIAFLTFKRSSPQAKP